MSGDRWLAVVGVLGALILVIGSAGFGRRHRRGEAGRYGLLWLAIFGCLFVVALWVDRGH